MELPLELIQHVMMFTSLRDLLSLRRTCRLLRTLYEDPPFFRRAIVPRIMAEYDHLLSPRTEECRVASRGSDPVEWSCSICGERGITNYRVQVILYYATASIDITSYISTRYFKLTRKPDTEYDATSAVMDLVRAALAYTGYKLCVGETNSASPLHYRATISFHLWGRSHCFTSLPTLVEPSVKRLVNQFDSARSAHEHQISSLHTRSVYL